MGQSSIIGAVGFFDSASSTVETAYTALLTSLVLPTRSASSLESQAKAWNDNLAPSVIFVAVFLVVAWLFL